LIGFNGIIGSLILPPTCEATEYIDEQLSASGAGNG